MNFIQQAYKGKNDAWRYILSLISILLGWMVLGSFPIMIAAVLKSPNMGAYRSVLSDISQGKGIDANVFLLLMISSFAIGLFFLVKSVKWFHNRNFLSLLTSRESFDWKRLLFAFTLWFIIALVLLTIDYYQHPDDFVWNFKPKPFFILVVISFLILPIQTSFEEILFRGYLMQILGITFKNRWFPLFFSAISFGLLHSFNPEVEKLGPIVMVYYIGTGFLFGISTLMDEGLELSLGMHAANNIVAAVFVTSSWTVFQTDALFIDNSDPDLGLEMYLPVFVIYPILLVIFSKKYQWKDWKKHLFGRVSTPVIPPEDKFQFPNPQD